MLKSQLGALPGAPRQRGHVGEAPAPREVEGPETGAPRQRRQGGQVSAPREVERLKAGAALYDVHYPLQGGGPPK